VSILGPILVDGAALPEGEASISVLDIGLQRGYGCFESVRAYAGKPFRLGNHLDRLESSAAIMRIPLPPRTDIERWVRHRAAEGDCSIRVIVTGGVDAEHPGVHSRTIVIASSLPSIPPHIRLQPRVAPWHADGRVSELTGAKSLSYGPNLAARLAAVADGFDDALLCGVDGDVLEGPTYSIGWIMGDRLEFPGPELGVLAGVTSAAVSEVAPRAGLVVAPGRYPLSRLLQADEVVAMSTLRAVRPVIALGDVAMPPGPMAELLNTLYDELVAAELGLG